MLAVDMWSAGVILLMLMTDKYPFFKSSNDLEALMEIANIYGMEEMKHVAFYHRMLAFLHQTSIYFSLSSQFLRFYMLGRTFVTTVPTVTTRIPYQHVVKVVRMSGKGISEEDYKDPYPKVFYEFLNECLELRHDLRLRPSDALKHPFLLLN
jgi:cell division control protein 7